MIPNGKHDEDAADGNGNSFDPACSSEQAGLTFESRSYNIADIGSAFGGHFF